MRRSRFKRSFFSQRGGSGAEFLFMLFIILLVLLAFGTAAASSLSGLWDTYQCEYGDGCAYNFEDYYTPFPTPDFSYLTPSPSPTPAE